MAASTFKSFISLSYSQQSIYKVQMNIWNIIYLNCGERYEHMIDHRSYTHNLSSCEIEAWKKIFRR